MLTDQIVGWDFSPHQTNRPHVADCPEDSLSAEGENMTGESERSSGLDDTLLAIEARMDRRIDRLEQAEQRRVEDYRRELELRDEAFRREQAARDKALDERFSGFLAAQAERDKRIDSEIQRFTTAHAEIKSSISSMKTTLIVTALSATIAIVGGIAAFNATLTSNMLSAYQTGKGDRLPAAEQANQPATPAATPAAPTRK